MLSSLSKPVLFVISLSFSSPIWAHSINKPLNRSFYDIGISQNQFAIKVHHASGEKSPEPKGLIESKNYTSAYLAVNSPYNYFDITGKDVGYYYKFSYNSFALKEQPIFNDSRTSKEEVNGYFVLGNAVIFLNFGAPYVQEQGLSSKLGVGLGLGYIRATGNMLINNRGIIEDQTLDFSKLGLSYEVFVEARKGYWFSRLTYSGPEVEDNDYIYTFVKSAIELGYSFNF